jgi:hypothetical protein
MKYIDNFLLKNLIQEIYLEEKQKMNESSTIEAIGTIAAMGAMPFLMGLIKNYLAYKNVPRDDIGAIVEDMKKDYNFMEDIKNLQSKGNIMRYCEFMRDGKIPITKLSPEEMKVLKSIMNTLKTIDINLLNDYVERGQNIKHKI